MINMPEAGEKQTHKNIRKLLHSKSLSPKSYKKISRKPKPRGNTLHSPMSRKKLADFLSNSRKKDFRHRNVHSKETKSLTNQSSISSQNQEKQLASICSDENAKPGKGDHTSGKVKRRRKRKRTTKTEVDQASRLLSRTRYLLVKMKLEQNLLDAYSTEGWKGQSREKIKPEKELQRAKKQILKCKLGIREAIRQLDLLSSDGCIEESVIAPDGSIHHDHIHCAKCKLREAFPDNDIILCDGTCNCAFHQMCIDPPLLTENIPPGDEGWFCKYCICRMEIIESMNAHLGTSYPNDSNWEEIFKVEATLPDGGDTFLNQQDWPSDDSEDDDYDPDGAEKGENSCSNSKAISEGEASDDASSSCSLWSLEEEVCEDESEKSRRKNVGLESTSAEFFVVPDTDSDCEIVSGRRQRRAVDYRKLYDEMFGKDALANEQVSEDEDWGPTKRKRREKESDAATTLMTLCESEEKCVDESPNAAKVETKSSSKETRRSLFRIPVEAVKKLRLVFAENELPSRAVKEDLSKQLGLDSEKVNKWFKNARYLALKKKKAGEEKPTQNESTVISKEYGSETGNDKATDENVSEDIPSNAQTPMNSRLKKFRRRKNPKSPTNPSKEQQDKEDAHLSTSDDKGDEECGDDDMSLKMFRENAKKEKKSIAVVSDSSGGGDQQQIQEQEAAEAEMERLCLMKLKLEKLQQLLLQRLPNRRSKNAVPQDDFKNIVYVPVAELKEKT